MRKRPTTHTDSSRVSPGWSPSARRMATVMILFHIAAVVIAPWSSPPPSSDLSRSLASLDSTLPEVDVVGQRLPLFRTRSRAQPLGTVRIAAAGRVIGQGTFPDRKRHWPRLLYHRQFMISEMIASELPPPVSPAEMARWNENERRMYERERRHGGRLVGSVAGELLRQHPQADAIRLFLVTHMIPTPLDVLAGRSLRGCRVVPGSPVG